MQLSAIEERLTVAGDAGSVDVLGSSVGSVISAREIESLPLNGRNFLELAFLTPGSAPAPNFDPTKAQSVIVSSAGQAGRGGNITIDGMDDNDDVVGGPLQNIPQDAVQEFQVATNRFSAELGRSAGSAINVVTRSGSDAAQGSAAAFLRDQSLAGAAGDARSRRWSAIRRSTASRCRSRSEARCAGRPCSRSARWRSGIRTAARSSAFATPPRGPSGAPSRRRRSTICSARSALDWRASAADDVMVRYSGQREDDISASAVDRAIGSASQRQQSRESAPLRGRHLDPRHVARGPSIR